MSMLYKQQFTLQKEKDIGKNKKLLIKINLVIFSFRVVILFQPMSYSFDQSLYHQSIRSFYQQTERNYPPEPSQPSQPSQPQQKKNQAQEKYCQFFGPILKEIQKCKAQNITKEALERHKIRILDQNDVYYGKIINHGGAYVQNSGGRFYGLQSSYDVVIGTFFLTIHVLNLHRNAQIGENFQSNIGKGSFGVVKLANVQNKKIAVKRIFFDDSKKNDISIPYIYDSKDRCDPHEIRQAIKQYCIYKICSMLKIGPQLIFDDVYDLVCYNDGIEFQMELCERVEGQVKNSYENDIKQCVAMLHSFKFIHKDLKPLNTLYSPSLGKYVMSDFGITHSVKQQINEKTQTYFQGSFHYVSPEMKKIFDIKKPGFVNLYQNDIHCLIETFKEVKNASVQVDVNQFSRNSMSMNEYADQNDYQSDNYNSNNYQSNNNSNDYYGNNNSNSYSEQLYEDDNNMKGNKYLQSSVKQEEQQDSSQSMKKTKLNKQSVQQRQSKQSKETFQSIQKNNVNFKAIQQISKDYQNSFLPANFPKQDLIKNSIEINFYQARVIYQILKQESQKKEMSYLMYMFSDLNLKDLKQNISKDEVSKLIKQKVNKICNHQKREMIIDIVYLFVENLLHHDRTYYRSIMQTRNKIRTFGIHSQQVVEQLKNLYMNRQIPNFNYAQLNANITLMQQYKQTFSEKKLDLYCGDLGRHNRLHNRKTLQKSLLQIIRSRNLLSGQMNIQKRKNVLIASMKFLFIQQVDTKLLLQIKQCMIQLFPPSKWKNQTLEIALLIKEGKKLKDLYKNMQLKSQILQIMYKAMQQQKQMSIHFLYGFFQISHSLRPRGTGQLFLLMQLKRHWDQLQAQTFDQEAKNRDQELEIAKRKEKYILTLHYYIQALLLTGYIEQVLKLGKQKIQIIRKFPHTHSKIYIYEKIVRASYRLKDYQYGEEINEECFQMLKTFYFPKINTCEFTTYYQLKAFAQMAKQQYRKAILTLQKQLSVVSTSIDESLLTNVTIEVCSRQGECHYYLQQYEKALDLYQKQLRYTFIYKTGQLPRKLLCVSDMIRTSMILGRKQNLSKLFDQLVALRTQHIYEIDDEKTKKNSLINFIKKMPIYLFEQQYHGTDQIVAYAKKVMLNSVDPYLPSFLWHYRKACQQVAEFYIKRQMPSKALPYLWKYFKVHPHQQRIYNESFYHRVDYFGNLLVKAHSGRRAMKFLQQHVFTMSGKFVNNISQILKKLTALSRDFAENIHPFYSIIWKNKGYRNQQNRQCCLKQLQLVQNVFLRKIYLKKFALLTVGDENQFQPIKQNMTPFDIFALSRSEKNHTIQNEIGNIQKSIKQVRERKNQMMDTQEESQIQYQESPFKYQTSQFLNLIKKKRKQNFNKA